MKRKGKNCCIRYRATADIGFVRKNPIIRKALFQTALAIVRNPGKFVGKTKEAAAAAKKWGLDVADKWREIIEGTNIPVPIPAQR